MLDICFENICMSLFPFGKPCTYIYRALHHIKMMIKKNITMYSIHVLCVCV